MLKKGISPLIAAVLLIAFTMAIGGIMASWATTFSSEKLLTSSEKSDCIGALDISNLNFADQMIDVRVKNLAKRLNLTSLTATIEYKDPTLTKINSNIKLKDKNVTDPIPPGMTDVFIYNTSSSVKPEKIEIVAGNCPDNSVSLKFR